MKTHGGKMDMSVISSAQAVIARDMETPRGHAGACLKRKKTAKKNACEKSISSYQEKREGLEERKRDVALREANASFRTETASKISCFKELFTCMFQAPG